MSHSGNSTSSPPPPSKDDSSNDDSSPPPPSPSSPEPPPSSPEPPPSSPPPPSPSSSPPPPDKSSPPSSDKSSPPPPKSSSNNGNSNSPPPPPPPPPPPGTPSRPSPSSNNKLSPSSDHGSNSNTDKAVLVGVVAGAGLLLIIMIVFLVSCTRRRKRKPRDSMHYYRDNSHGNDYYKTTGNGWPNNNSAQNNNNHELRMPPSTQVSSEYSWPIQPPPPPPMMSSSEMNSGNFSGARNSHHPPLPLQPQMSLGMNQSSFSYEDLAAATGGFAKTNMLGQGGFGYVYKGVLPNGKEVAVKSLKANSGQGETEFQAEVDIISRVHHRHLVSLVGYCIAGDQRMLVYELVQNDTLEAHLHGKGHQIMDWPTRLRVALGSAKGFAYLHEDCHPRIIHRDIKASNILLDENFEAKVADFGLAKLSSDTNTHVSTRIMGTFGYLAPEYASSGKLTEKSDVYSYGVVLLELITGKRPIDIHSDDDTLVDWARPLLKSAIESESTYEFEELVDPLLEGNYEPQEMLRMIACADACVRHSSRRRPKMSQVVRALEGDAFMEDLGETMKHSPSMGFGSGSGSEYDSKKFKKTGLSSQEFSSNEYGTTGEFVHRV